MEPGTLRPLGHRHPGPGSLSRVPVIGVREPVPVSGLPESRPDRSIQAES